jgi:hypothetical protein
MAITRLSGGLTPANGADPRTFPAVWNGTADFIEGNLYTPASTFSYGHVANTTLNPVVNRLYYAPILLPQPVAVSEISLQVSAAGSAGSVVRLGIYLPGANGLPSALLVDAGTIDGTSSTKQSISISESVSGLVYLCAVAQVATCTVRSMNTVAIPDYTPIPTTAFMNTREVLFEESVSGALPAAAASSFSGATNGPALRVTIA